MITRLKSQFARHGIPDELISDNVPQFSKSQFSNFTRTWDFEHTTNSPHYPQYNGMSERAIQTTKSILHKAKLDHQDTYTYYCLTIGTHQEVQYWEVQQRDSFLAEQKQICQPLKSFCYQKLWIQ